MNNFSNGSTFDLKLFNDSFTSASFVDLKDNSWFGIDNKKADIDTDTTFEKKFEAYQKSYNDEKKVKCTTIAAYNSIDRVSYNSIESVYRDNIFLCGSTMFSDDVTVEEQAKLQEFDAENISYTTIDETLMEQKRVFQTVKDQLSSEIAFKQIENKNKLILS
jgi:hypothetical protein